MNAPDHIDGFAGLFNRAHASADRESKFSYLISFQSFGSRDY